MARPASSREAVPVRPSMRESASTAAAARIAPPKAHRLSALMPRPEASSPSTVAMAAPSAAPEETPNTCGSAMGLPNTACMHAPEAESAAPVM